VTSEVTEVTEVTRGEFVFPISHWEAVDESTAERRRWCIDHVGPDGNRITNVEHSGRDQFSFDTKHPDVLAAAGWLLGAGLLVLGCFSPGLMWGIVFWGGLIMVAGASLAYWIHKKTRQRSSLQATLWQFWKLLRGDLDA
jgi:hypothetical protein